MATTQSLIDRVTSIYGSDPDDKTRLLIEILIEILKEHRGE